MLAHRLIDRDYLDICSLCVFEACLLDLFGLVLYLASCGLDSSLDAIETLLSGEMTTASSVTKSIEGFPKEQLRYLQLLFPFSGCDICKKNPKESANHR